MTDEYEIGYGKPPQYTRFQKGKSGNPKGRPKKKNTTFFDMAADIANKKITVHERGRPKRVKLIEALVSRIFSDALKGDAASQRLIAKTFNEQEKSGKNRSEFKEMRKVYQLMGDIIVDGKKVTFDIGQDPDNTC